MQLKGGISLHLAGIVGGSKFLIGPSRILFAAQLSRTRFSRSVLTFLRGEFIMGRSALSVVEQKQIHDLPTISAYEARYFFGCGTEHFRKRFAECLYTEIRHVDIRKGKVFVLVDVIKSAFPEADNYTVHKIAVEYLQKRGAQRKKGGRHL